jgi:hypothetical protein
MYVCTLANRFSGQILDITRHTDPDHSAPGGALLASLNTTDTVMDTSIAAADPQTSATVNGEANSSAVSWPAVIAGTVVAAATSLVLLALGSGLGLASISPWSGSGVSVATFTAMTAIWLIVVQWVASGLGGYLTGRLRSKWVRVHTHEVFFRDTAHGLLTWALASVLGVALLGSAVASALDSGVRAGGSAASGAVGAASAADNPYDIDTLFRSSNPGAADSASNTSPEAARILGHALAAGQMPAADRTYLAQLAAARSGISQEQAAQRVDTVMAQARAAMDTARKASAMASIYIALSMLIGAFIAGVASAVGGRMRDMH